MKDKKPDMSDFEIPQLKTKFLLNITNENFMSVFKKIADVLQTYYLKSYNKNESLTGAIAREESLRTIYYYLNRDSDLLSKSVMSYYTSSDVTTTDKNNVLDKEQMLKIVEYLAPTLERVRKARGKAHFPILFIAAEKAIEKGWTSEEFSNKVERFFTLIKDSDDSEYSKHSTVGTLRLEHVHMRKSIMLIKLGLM